MKDFLEKLEEKFVFKTSRYFFHVLVGIAILGLLSGVLLLLWGITPSAKPEVKKTEYPPAIQVSAEELLPVVIPPAKAAKPKEAAAQPAPAPETPAGEKKTEIMDSTQIAYNRALDSLKALIPPAKYSWADRGRWERGYYRDRRGNYQYGDYWVIDAYGLQSQLESAFREAGAESFTQKTALLDSYLPVLRLFEEKQRVAVLKSLLLYTKESVAASQSNVALLAAAIPNFSTEKTDFLNKLAQFGKKNPRDGAAFIAYANQILPNFDRAYAEPVLDALINSYYRFFDDIEYQKRVTGPFLSLLPRFEGPYQARAVEAYYSMYFSKNQSREQQIALIERQYERDLREAESILAQKQAAKAVHRYRGLIGVGGSIMFIAVVALILVLLSIQRNIKEIRARVAEEGEKALAG